MKTQFITKHNIIVSDEKIKEGDSILCDERTSTAYPPQYVIRTCKSIENGWVMTHEVSGLGENPDWTKKIIAGLPGLPSIDYNGFEQRLKNRLYTESEVYDLMSEAFDCAWRKYDVVEAGLESKDMETELRWLLGKYSKQSQAIDIEVEMEPGGNLRANLETGLGEYDLAKIKITNNSIKIINVL